MEEGKSIKTVDHDEIRNWVESRNGKPAKVKGTGDEGSGLLRIRFSEEAGNLEDVSWDEFFKAFEQNDLAFLYQEKTAEGDESRFFKLIKR